MCPAIRATASPRCGWVPAFEIAPVMPVRIGHHGLPAEFVKRDVLRRMACRAGDRQRREHALRIGGGPLQHLHAAHRAADHAEQRLDAEPVEQHGLRAHHVGNGDDRKIQPPGLAGGRIGRGRTGRAHAAADHVRADDEVSVGIERPAGTDHDFPPAGLAGQRMHIGDVLIAGQRMADQNGVGAIGIEFAIGLIGDLERREIDAAIELQRLVDAELRHRRSRMIGLVRRDPRYGSPGLGIDCTFVISAPTSSRRLSDRNQAIKKPGLNKGSAGINSVPGLFSELFNVAASRPAQMTTEWDKASPAAGISSRQAVVSRGAMVNRTVQGAPCDVSLCFRARRLS